MNLEPKAPAWAVLASLACMLIVCAPFASAQGPDEPGDYFIPDPDAPDLPPAVEGRDRSNNLIVVSADGEVQEWQDNGGQWTDIRVTGVTPALSGFALEDPNDNKVFLNQSSTSEGYVEFWSLTPLAGPYRVYDESGVSPVLVAEFDATPYAKAPFDPNRVVGVHEAVARKVGLPGQAPAIPELPEAPLPGIPGDQASGGASGSGSNGGNSNGKSQAQGTSSGSSSSSSCSSSSYTTTTKLAESTVWTPLVINHAPYLGKSMATGTWTSGKGRYILPYGYTSEFSSGWSANIEEGGKTKGVFQLAKWGYYKIWISGSCGNPEGTTKYSAKVFDWQPQGYLNYRNFDLWGSSQTSDTDDLQTVSYGGYGSVTFGTRWLSKDAQYAATSGTTTATVSSTLYSKIGGSVSFSYGGSTKSFSFSPLELYAYKSNGSSYVYTFPPGPKCWHIDHLGSGSTGGWAFKYTGTSC